MNLSSLRRSRRLALGCASFLVAWLLLIGCTTAPVPPVSGNSPLPTASWTDSMRPDHSGWINSLPRATDAVMVSPHDAKHLVSMPWRFIGISSDKLTLDVAYLAGDNGCVKPVGFAVATSGDDIDVRAMSKQVAGAQACADLAVIRRAHVTLPAALTGHTHLVHGPIDPAYRGNVFG